MVDIQVTALHFRKMCRCLGNLMVKTSLHHRKKSRLKPRRATFALWFLFRLNKHDKMS